MRPLNLIGKKFSMLQVVCLSNVNRNKLRYWECICDCGSVKTYSTDHLTRKDCPVKSCGCIKYNSGSKHKDWIGFGDISGTWWSQHVLREINQKKRKSVEMSLTIEVAWSLFIKQNRKCALSGVHLYFGSRSHKNTASLDRIDSSKGYTIDNIQWVHKHINFMKRDFDQLYFLSLCQKVVDNITNGVCGI